MEKDPITPLPQSTSSKVDALDIELQEIKSIVFDNIDKTLQNIDIAQELETSSNTLRSQSKQFALQSKKAKRKYWWKSTRCTFIITMIAAGTIYYLYESVFD